MLHDVFSYIWINTVTHKAVRMVWCNQGFEFLKMPDNIIIDIIIFVAIVIIILARVQSYSFHIFWYPTDI